MIYDFSKDSLIYDMQGIFDSFLKEQDQDQSIQVSD